MSYQKKKMPDSEWEKKERDEKYPVEITQRTEPKPERKQDYDISCKRPKIK